MTSDTPPSSNRPPGKRNEPVLTRAQRRSLVERRILDAMEAGAFDNLPGAGKPLHIDEPPSRNADLWWTLRLLGQANIVTDEVHYRQQIEALRRQLRTAQSEQQVRRIVQELNDWVRKLNTMGTNAIPTNIALLNEEHAVTEWRRRGAV